ncbi:MAG: cupin domain-containing protein [Meiothermus sp.]|uniref:cupin domain-containing protein n=1 Tax=Meiothermus sp. TaxID=1955249 RepID=UPI0028CCEDDA|nr:cupin domain-containing protein [Meiothermus sp.]MDT7920921.1 cupin domain-containing protein [Meiothermus sp.]
MSEAKFWVEHLGLAPHLEGGFYRQTYLSPESIAHPHLPPRYSGQRPFSSAIYFLLEHPDFSAFHRLQSDEVWHFYKNVRRKPTAFRRGMNANALQRIALRLSCK